MMHRKIIFIFTLCSLFLIARSQTADEIVSRYITFIGGVQKWKTVKTITSSGIYNYGGMKFPFKAYSKSPNFYKYVVTSNGKSFTQAYNGKTGWRIDGFNNETKKTLLKDKQATAMANEADVELESPLINYRTKGHKLLMEGIDTVDSKPCYKIKLLRKNHDTATYFFDTKNFALVEKQAISKNTEMNGALMDIFYSNYEETNGVKIPRTITCLSDGQKILTITIESIQLNLPLADAFFKP